MARRLPVEFRANLTDARIARILDNPEAPVVVDVAAGIVELRVVEYVEEFDAQVESHLLFKNRSLQDAKVGVVESRAMEEAPVGGDKRTESRVRSECARQEIASCTVWGRAVGIRGTRIHLHHRTHLVWHVRGWTSGQRYVVVG